MSKEFDPLAFDIGFALNRSLFNRSLTTFFRRMPEDDLDDLCRRVADHLRRSGWVRKPPDLQFRMPKMSALPP